MKHIPLKLYYDAYYNFRKHCRRSKALLRFEANYALNLYDMRCSIIARKINLGISHAFVVKKPKPREVFAGSVLKRKFDEFKLRKEISEMIPDKYKEKIELVDYKIFRCL